MLWSGWFAGRISERIVVLVEGLYVDSPVGRSIIVVESVPAEENDGEAQQEELNRNVWLE